MGKETKLIQKLKRLLRRLGCPRWLHHFGPKTYEFLEHLHALIIKAYCRLSYRRVREHCDLLGIRCPSKSALQYTAAKLDTAFWQKILSITCGNSHLVAIDSTGLSRTNPSYHYLKRIDGNFPCIPIKLSTAFDTRKKKFCAAKIRVLPAHDIKDAKFLLKNSNPRIAVADKGYSAEYLFKFAHEHNMVLMVPAKKNAKRGRYRKKMARQYRLRTYHRRSLVESSNSSIKRKFGASVSSKTVRTIRTEVYLRLVCHNLFSWLYRLLGQSLTMITFINKDRVVSVLIEGKMAKDVQPIFILPESTTRTTGRSAQRNNIAAAKLVAETVRTTLGPKGMDKMLVDALGDITITNDGATILREMQMDHPAAKMLVEVAKTQEEVVGDGTTTAAVLAGELLKQAETLLDKNIHPTIIVKGYRIAEEKTQIILRNISEHIDERNLDLLKKIALTAMTGKGAEVAKEKLSLLCLKALIKVIEKDEKGNFVIERDDIAIEKKIGNSVEDSEIIEGLILDKEKVHSGMPQKLANPKIALIDSALEIKNTEIEAKIQITDPSQLHSFLETEERIIKEMVDKLSSLHVNVVFCQKGIDELAQHYLAKHSIYACRRVKKSDMAKLARATGAAIVTKLSDLSSSDLGYAEIVEERKMGDDNVTYVSGTSLSKSVTILVKGGTEHIVAEVKRAMEDAIGDLVAAIKSGRVVAGAGACEVEVARNLRLFATSLSGREQLAVLAFADAMEIIPITLAENAGLDPIDVLTDLKVAHDKGVKWAGIDVFTGKIIDAWDEGIIEPLKIKTQAVSSAAEVAEMILRIDDVIASGQNQPMQKPMNMDDMGN